MSEHPSLEAMILIDETIASIRKQTIVPVSDMLDVLLDMRNIISSLVPESATVA